jgi:hypothetical protein
MNNLKGMNIYSGNISVDKSNFRLISSYGKYGEPK